MNVLICRILALWLGLLKGESLGYKDMTLVPDFFSWLAEEVDKFWIDNIQGKKEPTAANIQDILLKYNSHTAGKVVEVNDEIFSACQDLKSVKEELSMLEEKKTGLEEKIKMGFGDAEAISYGGQTLATWKAPKPSTKFDTKAFTVAHPDLAKEFTIPYHGARRFLLK